MAISSKALFRATKPKRHVDAAQTNAAANWPIAAIPTPPDFRDELDYDPTPADATSAFLAAEGSRIREIGGAIWEPAVGGGHMAQEMVRYGFDVIGSDVVDRGYAGTIVRSLYDWTDAPCRIGITNPPYCEVNARDGHGRWLRHMFGLGLPYIALLLNWDWIAARTNGMDEIHSERPASRVYVCTWKIDFRGGGSPPQRNGWFVWDADWTGETVLRRLFREDGYKLAQRELEL